MNRLTAIRFRVFAEQRPPLMLHARALIAVADAAEALLNEPLHEDPEHPGLLWVDAGLVDGLFQAVKPLREIATAAVEVEEPAS